MKGRGAASAARDVVVDACGVIAAWTALLLVENVAVAALCRDLFSGAWEVAHARWFLSPVALAVLAPCALLAVGLGRLWARRDARALAVVAAIGGGLSAFGVSTGRHFDRVVVRVAFVALVAGLAGAVVFALVRRVPTGKTRPALVATALVASMVAWLADAFVLPRLYPAFHAALLVVTLLAWAAGWSLVRRTRARMPVAIAGGVLVVVGLVFARVGARRIATEDNVRRVLLEHAPLFGRAVVVASRLAPPPSLDEEATSAASAHADPSRPSAPARTLDWTGRDVVLLTVDALRADHVSAYGYARKTTPNVDRLAARGALFAHAYCPTPHTSYSVASLMTGKYMRPLLALGVGSDSETWADLLRHYGYRTAAFYPPAVFFIDTHKFTALRDRSLGFEYAKVEFAGRELRKAQVRGYLEHAPKDKPLFLWLHAFEPHEPYEMHAEHPFSGEPAVDAYDSEIAEADAIVGDVVDAVEAARPGAVVVFTADHGEEFGDHGGRYHGTSVYEEQVRVPLVVVGPGVAPRVIDAPVQTIDVLPTVLSALDVPMPARIRGRDLGPWLAGKSTDDARGFAFAETDDDTLVASGDDRLVCARRIAACTLFDVAKDPEEKRPVVDRPERIAELRKLTASVERENGKLEAALPEALRRGLQGDRDAAEDVGPLLDDARVDVRRAAARCAFRLRAPELRPQLRRALAHDEDPQVTAWAALALLRLDEAEVNGGAGVVDADAPTAQATASEKVVAPRRDAGPPEAAAVRASEALASGEPSLRVAAALAFAERGDPRGQDVLIARWDEAFTPNAPNAGELDEAREILHALATIRARAAVPHLLSSLDDVRLRPAIVDVLATIGDLRARGPLIDAFTNERYLHLRAPEARALVALGARSELRAPLARFAGVPTPMVEALAIARDAGLLDPAHGGYVATGAPRTVDVVLHLPGTSGARLFVATEGPPSSEAASSPAGSPPSVRIGGAPLVLTAVAAPIGDRDEDHGELWVADLPRDPGTRVPVHLEHAAGLRAAWLVRLADEIPAPKPVSWKSETDGVETTTAPLAGPDGGG